ncbi:MAG: signal recognition particle protein [Gammaproteobacteria bacterium]|nr:signal recognition particle protein [Gammaproteobacteria bacterium]
MFDSLSQRLTAALRGLSGKAYLSEVNIQETLREVRLALLDADVALEVVRSFTEGVRRKAIGQSVSAGINPGEAFVRVVHDELVRLMGERNDALNLAAAPPAVVLMAGLQGAGKTTTAAKLARLLIEREKKKVSLVSADVYRPAAIEQLRTLSEEVHARYIPSAVGQEPITIAEGALTDAKTQFDDVLIVDTAGRLAIDDGMMAEIRALHGVLRPVETLFVVDAMTGQDAANAARAFDEALQLTGVVLAKADGDARGGAALSVRAITGKPIKFIGVGEKTDGLEAFHPDRMASRILGMGDVLGLIEEVERKVDRQKAQRLARKAAGGRRFDLEDFRDQLQQMARMGGVGGMLDRLPGAGQMPRTGLDDADFRRMEAVINSMTPRERRFPDTIDGSRKRRISAGSGTRVQDVNRLLKQHKQMQKFMRKATRRGGMDRMLRNLQAQGQVAQRPRFRR